MMPEEEEKKKKNKLIMNLFGLKLKTISCINPIRKYIML